MDQESFNKLLREKLPCVWEGLHVQLVEVAEDRVTVQIPMAGNGNDKGTMFAGAAYSALVVAGWCLVMNRALASGFKKPWAAIVDVHCHYAKPVVEDALATATFAEPPVLVPGARNWPKVQVQIGEQIAFEGVYAVGEVGVSLPPRGAAETFAARLAPRSLSARSGRFFDRSVCGNMDAGVEKRKGV